MMGKKSVRLTLSSLGNKKVNNGVPGTLFIPFVEGKIPKIVNINFILTPCSLTRCPLIGVAFHENECGLIFACMRTQAVNFPPQNPGSAPVYATFAGCVPGKHLLALRHTS